MPCPTMLFQFGIPDGETLQLRKGKVWARWCGAAGISEGDRKAIPIILCSGGTGAGMFYKDVSTTTGGLLCSTLFIPWLHLALHSFPPQCVTIHPHHAPSCALEVPGPRAAPRLLRMP